ncbi:MAG: hypothetical protein ACI37Q_03680 [Candidatus Gastranaerophilaceae bacterium]
MAIKMNSGNHDYFNRLQLKIEQAQADNKPFLHYVKRQLELLEEAHDEFVAKAQKEGFDINAPKVGEIEVQQYSAMRALAEKWGLPSEKYDNLIKNVQIRIFGKENYENFFGK